MKLQVQMMYLSEGELEAPDNLSEEELRDWISDHLDDANCSNTTAVFDSVYVIDPENENEEVYYE